MAPKSPSRSALGETTGKNLARMASLLVVGVAWGLAFNALRESPVSLSGYEPAATCEGTEHAIEPVVESPEAIAARCALGGDVRVIDTRGADAFARGHVAGAQHLPCTAPRLQAQELLAMLGPVGSVVVYGDDTQGALEVARSLSAEAQGMATFVVDGGFAAWERAALACASGACDRCEQETAHVH